MNIKVAAFTVSEKYINTFPVHILKIIFHEKNIKNNILTIIIIKSFKIYLFSNHCFKARIKGIHRLAPVFVSVS